MSQQPTFLIAGSVVPHPGREPTVHLTLILLMWGLLVCGTAVGYVATPMYMAGATLAPMYQIISIAMSVGSLAIALYLVRQRSMADKVNGGINVTIGIVLIMIGAFAIKGAVDIAKSLPPPEPRSSQMTPDPPLTPIH